MKGKNNSGYALRRPWVNGKSVKAVLMHRLIGNTPDYLQCDHKDGNGINNQKNNLRNCTSTENKRNQKKHKGTSIYKGVSVRQGKNYWKARIGSKHIGYFKKERHAAIAYDIWAKEIYGEFAQFNFPKRKPLSQ